MNLPMQEPKSDNPSPSEGLKRFAANNQLHPADELRQKFLQAAKSNFDEGDYIEDTQDWRRFFDDAIREVHVHMQAVLRDVIGKKYNPKDYPFGSAQIEAVVANRLQAEQWERAAKWLPKEEQ